MFNSASSGQSEDVFQHDEAVYGLSTDPNNENIFASACDDGRVLVYDTREPATSGNDDALYFQEFMSLLRKSQLFTIKHVNCKITVAL